MLADGEELTIVRHNNPDPDCLASDPQTRTTERFGGGVGTGAGATRIRTGIERFVAVRCPHRVHRLGSSRDSPLEDRYGSRDAPADTAANPRQATDSLV
jgi:hypothetical protein